MGEEQGEQFDEQEELDGQEDPMGQLRDLVSYLAKSLVDVPDEVEVQVVPGDGPDVIELTVAPGDLGKVIGREGRTARAIRTLVTATSSKYGRRAILEILE